MSSSRTKLFIGLVLNFTAGYLQIHNVNCMRVKFFGVQFQMGKHKFLLTPQRTQGYGCDIKYSIIQRHTGCSSATAISLIFPRLDRKIIL